MSDVAALAGVATMTVSRVLSGSPAVSEQTRRRVHRAVEKLDYKPDHLASALRGSRSHTIGVLLPSQFDSRCSAILQGIHETALAGGYSVILGKIGDLPGNDQKEALKMARRRVDGLIVVSSRGSAKLSLPELNGLRVVNVDILSPISFPDSVAVEHRRGCHLAVRHLQEHGHRRVLFLCHSPRLHNNRQRLAGYRQAMQEESARVEAHVDCSSVEAVTAVLRAGRTSTDPATALVAADRSVVHHIFQAMKRLGIRAPQQLALIGCDDFEMADILQPALTVVSQPVYRMGREAAQLLLSRVEGTRVDEATHITLPCELVLRGSCGCAALDVSKANLRSYGVVENSTLPQAADASKYAVSRPAGI